MGLLSDERLLRETVRRLLRERRHVTLQGQNKQDLEMAIHWIKQNKKLRSAGDIESLDNHTYIVRLYVKGGLDNVVDLVRDRFGYFVRVIR